MALSALRGGAAGAAATPDPLQSLMDLLRRRPSARASKKDHIKRVADKDIHLPGSDVQPLPELSAKPMTGYDAKDKGTATKLFFPEVSVSGVVGTEQPVLSFPRQSLKGVYATLPRGSVLTEDQIETGPVLADPSGDANKAKKRIGFAVTHADIKGTITDGTRTQYKITNYRSGTTTAKNFASVTSIKNYNKEPKMTAINTPLPGPKFYVITDESRVVDGEDLAKDFGRMRVTMQELGNNKKMVTETNRLDRIPPLEGVVKEFLACAKGLSYTYQADGAASGAARKRVALPETGCRLTALGSLIDVTANYHAFLVGKKVKLAGAHKLKNALSDTVYTCTHVSGTNIKLTSPNCAIDATENGSTKQLSFIIQGEERDLDHPVDEFDVHLFRPSKVSQAFQQLLAQDVLQDHEAFTVKDLLACYLYFKTGYEVKDNVDTQLKTLFNHTPEITGTSTSSTFSRSATSCSGC